MSCRYFTVALGAVIAGEFGEIEICLLRAVRPDQDTNGATETRVTIRPARWHV
jgi:hypothetical protein